MVLHYLLASSSLNPSCSATLPSLLGSACSCKHCFFYLEHSFSHNLTPSVALCLCSNITSERGLSSEFHLNLLLCFFFMDFVTIYSFSFTPYVQFLSIMLPYHSLGQLSLSVWLWLLLVQPWKGKGGRAPRNTGYFTHVPLRRNW